MSTGLNTISHAVIFQPHNDDAVISIGGVLLKLLRANWEVHYVYVTDSRNGGDEMLGEEVKRIRDGEADHERQLLGLAEYTNLGFVDGSLSGMSANEWRTAVIDTRSILLRQQPQVVFVPARGELHPDHMATHDLVCEALGSVSPRPLVVKYSVWLMPPIYDIPIDPADHVVLIGIDNEVAAKLALIRCHASQIARRRYDLASENLNAYFAWMMKADKRIGHRAAEIVGVYLSPDMPNVYPALLDSLYPTIDVTEIAHGRGS